QRKLLAFDVKALVVCKAPMEDIQFDRFHSIEIALNHRKRHKTMSRVDQKPTPGEARLVVDGNNGNAEAFRSDSYQLEKGLESAKHPKRVRRHQLNTGGRDLKAVRFVLAQLLDRRTRSGSLNYEIGCVEDCFAPQRDPGFPRKHLQKTLPCPFQPRFLVPLQSDAKISVNRKLTFAQPNVCGEWHDGKRAL